MPVFNPRLFFLSILCLLLLFFSCDLNHDDDDDDNDDEIRILPGYIEKELIYSTTRAPLITSLRVTGQSSGSPSYPIYALMLTDNPGQEENEPEIQFTGGIHGNEQLSCIMVLRMIDYMITLYNSNDPVITDIIDNNELHFFPVLNPFGLSQDDRYNANSVDLNRNFSWAWVGQSHHGDSPIDQPESQVIQDDALEHPYVLAIHGHTGAACINHLWDYIGTEISSGIPATYSIDDFINLYLPTYPFISDTALNYRDVVNTAGDDSFWMTEGYDWYPVFGSLQDWTYGVRGGLAYTVEYHPSSNHTLLYEELFVEVFDNHKDALIDLFMSARKGISGIVTGNGGIPVEAKVEVTPASKRDYADPVVFTPFCFTDADAGDYHLPVQPGTYNLEISADGYITAYRNNIVVPAEDPWSVIVEEIQLTPGRGEKHTPYMPPELQADSIPPDLRNE